MVRSHCCSVIAVESLLWTHCCGVSIVMWSQCCSAIAVES